MSVARRSVRITVRPLTPDRWRDFETLFGERGACGGCWCMWWRLPRAEFERGKGDGNRRAMRRLVSRGVVPGLIAYEGDEPVGWCALGPRESYPRLDRSRVLARVDDAPVWSVVCFFVSRSHRGRGLTARMLEEAARFAASRGADTLEGYPVAPRKGRMPDAFVYTGLPGSFEKAGFREVARRSDTRPIVRRAVEVSDRGPETGGGTGCPRSSRRRPPSRRRSSKEARSP